MKLSSRESATTLQVPKSYPIYIQFDGMLHDKYSFSVSVYRDFHLRSQTYSHRSYIFKQ